MSTTTRTVHRSDSADIQKAAMAVGAVFLLVGILGFIPGITTNFGDISFAGHDSSAKLLGVFQVSVLHNLVHLLFGVVGLIAAKRMSSSRTYLIGGGVVYLALLVYGLIVDHNSNGNFIPVNRADDWLHLGLGLGMIALGLALSRHLERETHRTSAPRGSVVS
ncbi:MAG: hypothetical protein JWN99_2621 [Ilumatobacteraceae bacterium]|nr:hypothetical protein [Ilumatobacteraceae bacterium]